MEGAGGEPLVVCWGLRLRSGLRPDEWEAGPEGAFLLSALEGAKWY